MVRPKPLKITLEFDDGSKSATVFEALPTSLQREILRQPFSNKPNKKPDSEKYVLLEWDDGWTEVVRVDAACTEINRYYVISREEKVGRLSLKTQSGYPELIEVPRKPLRLEKITFNESFRIRLERSVREGNKTDHFFALAKKGEPYEEMVAKLKQIVNKEGFEKKELTLTESAPLQEKYETIRRKIGIKAGVNQQDVLDFIAYLVSRL